MKVWATSFANGDKRLEKVWAAQTAHRMADDFTE
jgi:hypothetical protein